MAMSTMYLTNRWTGRLLHYSNTPTYHEQHSLPYTLRKDFKSPLDRNSSTSHDDVTPVTTNTKYHTSRHVSSFNIQPIQDDIWYRSQVMSHMIMRYVRICNQSSFQAYLLSGLLVSTRAEYRSC